MCFVLSLKNSNLAPSLVVAATPIFFLVHTRPHAELTSNYLLLIFLLEKSVCVLYLITIKRSLCSLLQSLSLCPQNKSTMTGTTYFVHVFISYKTASWTPSSFKTFALKFLLLSSEFLLSCAKCPLFIGCGLCHCPCLRKQSSC